MSTPEPTPDADPARSPLETRDLADLRDSVAALRSGFLIALAALVLVMVSVNFFMFHQVRLMRRQGYELRLSAFEMAKGVGDYETNNLPMMIRFTADLQRFAQRNPDFAPILAKYPLPSPTNAPASTPPATAPPRGGAKK